MRNNVKTFLRKVGSETVNCVEVDQYISFGDCYVHNIKSHQQALHFYEISIDY
jgi:hypothetical protein